MRLRPTAALLATTLALVALPAGPAAAGPPRADSVVISEPGATGHEPVVAGLPGGGAAIVWKAFRRPAGKSEVQARFAAPDGSLGPIVHVGPLRGSASNNRGPAEVAPLPGGRIAVGWYGRVAYVDPELGVTRTVEVTAGGDDRMQLAAAPDGSVGTVFEEIEPLGGGSYTWALRYRRIDPAGTPDQPETLVSAADYFDWRIAIADDGWTTVGWIENTGTAAGPRPVARSIAPDGALGAPVRYSGPGQTYGASLTRKPGGDIVAAWSRQARASANVRAELTRFTDGIPAPPHRLNRPGYIERLVLGQAPLGADETAVAWRRMQARGERFTEARRIFDRGLGPTLAIRTGAKVEELSVGAGSTAVIVWRGREQRLLLAPAGRRGPLPAKVRLGRGFRPSAATDHDAAVAYAAWAGKPAERGTRREPIRFAAVR